MDRLTANSLFDNQEELLKKMKDNFLACPPAVNHLKKLGVPEEEINKRIVKVNDFVEDIKFCKNCKGVNKCQKATPCLVTKMIYEDGILDRQVVPCKKYLEFIKFRNQFIVRDFPEEWLYSSLKDIDKSMERLELIKKYKSIIDNKTGEWIFITGEAGTGRSFVAANLCIDMATRDLGPIAFIDVPTRFKELGNKKEEAFSSLLEKYQKVPVLVLDDLGNEYKSDFVRETIFFQILNVRAKNNLFTIITSDFLMKDISDMYCLNQASKPKVEQIKRLLKRKCGEEINLGEIGAY